MRIRYFLILGLVSGLQVLAAGQNPPAPGAPTSATAREGTSERSTPATALSGIAGVDNEASAQDTYGTLPQIPGLLGGIGISPALLPELERSNYLRAGVNVGATYDDNPLLLSTGAVGNTSGSIFPNISIEETSSRMRWSLGYAGGLTVNQRFTNQNQGSHSLNFDSQFRLSPHVNLRVAETFAMTTGYFDGSTATGEVPVASAGGPNQSVITPLATQRSSFTTVETNYHIALHDLVGASGSFYDLHFSDIGVRAGTTTTAGTGLTNTQTVTGSAFWLHHMFQDEWGGFTYRFDRFTLSTGGETRVHSFYVVDTVGISKRFTFTAFAGPQYAENQGLLPGGDSVNSNTWSISGGAEIGWRDQHNGLSAGFSRTVSDGGGVLGVVRLQSVHGNYRRELAPGWAANFSGSYGANHSLTVPFSDSPASLNLTSAGVSVERNLGRSLGLRLGYAHDFQEQLGVPGATPSSPTQTLDAHRNRAFVTLSYQWAKPLGL